MRHAALLLAVLLMGIGCASAPVTHVVVCWLKDPGNAAARQQLIDDSRGFAKIPGIVSVSAGEPILSTRPAVDSSFDVAIVMKFKDQPSLNRYASHPLHVQAVERTLKPLVAKYVIYDYHE
jgi:hypothetical protein